MESLAPLLTDADLASRWHCSKRSVAELTRKYSKPRLKFVRISKKLFFKPEDVVAFENLHILRDTVEMKGASPS